MRTYVLCAASLTFLVAAGPAPAKDADSKPACDAKYYDYLVGKHVGSTAEISGTTNYRVIPQGADGGAPQPKRITVKVDKQNLITDITCG